MKLTQRILFVLTITAILSSCADGNKKVADPIMYTCPMPEDSVFSDKPGQCPKCGMELIEVQHQHSFAAEYTCPMHPEVNRESPGQCPICGMDLVKKAQGEADHDPQVHMVLRSTDAAVLTSLPVTMLQPFSGEADLDVYGTVGYDPRNVGNISSNVSGRIEKLFVRYRFQPIKKGQPIMQVYSPELLTAQQELLFLVQSDPSNSALINAAKQKLVLFGMSAAEVNSVVQKRKAINSVTIYCRYSGHIHDAGGEQMQVETPMKEQAGESTELSIREGAYVEKGKPVFTILDHHNVWALFQLRPAEGTGVKVGDKIAITGETEGDHHLVSTIRFIDPFYQAGQRLLTVRASLEGHQHLPAGTPLKGVIKERVTSAMTLPRESILSLGVRNIVYVRKSGLVQPVEIIIGKRLQQRVEVISGLSKSDSVILNSQYLADNETLIQLKK